MSRGPRPHSGHRSHRRRWTGPERDRHAPVRTLQLAPLPDCRPGFTCTWHGECSTCGETIHLATVDGMPMDWQPDPEKMARFICGTPPRCADCRGLT